MEPGVKPLEVIEVFSRDPRVGLRELLERLNNGKINLADGIRPFLNVSCTCECR